MKSRNLNSKRKCTAAAHTGALTGAPTLQRVADALRGGLIDPAKLEPLLVEQVRWTGW